MAQDTDPTQRKARLWSRFQALKSERSSWDPHAMELSRNLLPRNSRFMVADRNKGGKDRYNTIYDNTGTKSAQVLASGMMAGMTSPARPWFRLGTNDPELNQYEPVKVWLSTVSSLMLAIFAGSNTYQSFHQTYLELGVFGTHASIIAPDFEDVIRFTPLTFGEYAVTANERGVVDTLFREFDKPVHAVVKQFGLANVSPRVKRLFEQGKTGLDQWVTIIHAIEPRIDREYGKIDKLNMPYRSVYFEHGSDDKSKFLGEGGFKSFPGLVPRWEVTGGDVYGSSPGMMALGDVKQLQHQQLRKGQGIDYMTRPPIGIPTGMKNTEANTLPGGVTYYDGASGGKVGALWDVRLDLNHLLMDIQDVRQRIRAAFFEDLFLMLAAGDQTGRMTATEVAERHEEKLLMLGPVLERLHKEMLSPLVDKLFQRLIDANILPPPPPEMQNMALNVEFVSMLAQAQKAVSTNSVDRFVMQLGTVAQVKPEVLDKFNGDEWVDTYSDMLGVDPRLIVSDQDVRKLRHARVEAQQQAAADAQETQQADNMSKMAKVPTQGGASTAASDVMNQFSGYNSPAAEYL